MLFDTATSGQWWFAVAVTGAAAIASYVATWLFRRRDVERELALRCLSLLDAASDFARRGDEDYKDCGGGMAVKALLASARRAVRPLDDGDLDYRILVAERFAMDTLGWSVPRIWMEQTIENARLGLRGYLAPPRLSPWRKGARRAERVFPTHDAYTDAVLDDPNAIFEWIDRWMNAYAMSQRNRRVSKARLWIRRKLGTRSPYIAP